MENLNQPDTKRGPRLEDMIKNAAERATSGSTATDEDTGSSSSSPSSSGDTATTGGVISRTPQHVGDEDEDNPSTDNKKAKEQPDNQLTQYPYQHPELLISPKRRPSPKKDRDHGR